MYKPKNMGWSQVSGTELELEAYVMMNENEIRGCEYHNMEHINSMYSYLERINCEYDEALDWAILFHDIVYDSESEKETRSADTFMDMVDFYRGATLSEEDKRRVYNLIMCTENHTLAMNPIQGEKEIIFADLHQLANKKQAINNFSKIMNESVNIYEISVDDFAEATVKFMDGLEERVMSNMLWCLEDSKDVEFMGDILKGVKMTSNMARAILYVDR